MTAITLHLPDDKAARLRARAEASGEDPDAFAAGFAVAAVLRALDEEDQEDEDDAQLADTVAGIRRGLADVAAGRLLTLDEARERFEAGLAVRLK